MKKSILLAIATAFVLSGCSPKVLYQTNVGYINYSTYSEQGMFLTESNSVNFDYTSLGSVSVTVLSGNIEKSRPDRFNHVDGFGVRSVEKYSEWITASPEQAINAAVEEAKRQGGNGIINIKIEPITDVSTKITRSGFLITGMVIKK